MSKAQPGPVAAPVTVSALLARLRARGRCLRWHRTAHVYLLVPATRRASLASVEWVFTSLAEVWEAVKEDR